MSKKSNACRLLAAAALGAACLASSRAQDALPSGVTIIDGLMWSLETGGVSQWNDADAHCETLQTGAFSDWRLPSLAELVGLHDPQAPASIRGPFELEDCCAWSATSLEALPAERKGDLPAQGGPPGSYYWGFMFPGGISYYSNSRQIDGFAMCVREPDA